MLLSFVFGLPVILVLGAICFSFDSRLTAYQKIFYFLLLPMVEIIVSVIAVVQAKSTSIDLIDNWSLYLLYFSTSLGIIGTLVVTLVSELNSVVMLAIRFTTLTVFGSILAWVSLNLK